MRSSMANFGENGSIPVCVEMKWANKYTAC